MPTTAPWWDQLLQGRSQYGSAGFGLGEAIGSLNSGGRWNFNPAMAKYIDQKDEQDQTTFAFKPGGRIDHNGAVTINGKQYGQVGQDPTLTPQKYRSLDPSLFQYDPEFGAVTSVDNIVPEKDSWLDKNMIYLVGGALAGPVLAANGALGGALAGSEGGALSAETLAPMSSVPAADTAAIDAFLNGGAQAAADSAIAGAGGAAAAGGGSAGDLGAILSQDPYAVDVTANSLAGTEGLIPEGAPGYGAYGNMTAEEIANLGAPAAAGENVGSVLPWYEQLLNKFSNVGIGDILSKLPSIAGAFGAGAPTTGGKGPGGSGVGGRAVEGIQIPGRRVELSANPNLKPPKPPPMKSLGDYLKG